MKWILTFLLLINIGCSQQNETNSPKFTVEYAKVLKTTFVNDGDMYDGATVEDIEDVWYIVLFEDETNKQRYFYAVDISNAKNIPLENEIWQLTINHETHRIHQLIDNLGRE